MRYRFSTPAAGVFALALFCQTCCMAQIRLPRLLSDGAVLQRDRPVRLWGWASANETVTLIFKNKTYRTSAGASGNWTLELPPQPAGGAFELVFRGRNEVKIKDILFGDVWICAGQSNMVLPMERVKEKYADDIAAANLPEIRHFAVPAGTDLTHPRDDLPAGAWKAASPSEVLTFSATAFFFAKEIYEKYRVPIGLINTSYGGTPIEAWISEPGLHEFPDLLELAAKNKDTARIHATNRAAAAPPRVSTDRGLLESPPWYDTACQATGWRPVFVPGYWEDQGVKNLDGAVWYRREIALPASCAGAPAKLFLGRIVDADVAYLNGVAVGNITYQYPPRRYTVPSGILKAGKNLLVVRVLNYAGKGGFVPDKPYFLEAAGQKFELAGQWQYKVGEVFEPAAADAGIPLHKQPAALFNAMVAPLTPYAAKGFLWYQGESNAAQPEAYRRLLPALIADWRARWQGGDLPFLYVQLANFMDVAYAPEESQWAELRDAQLQALSVPNTAMAVAIDAGEWNDIHPLNKKDIGRRLALGARALAYGEKTVVFSGPVYRQSTVEGNRIRLRFEHTGSGLASNDGDALRCFAIAGADKKFVWANAAVEADNTVSVWSDRVPRPLFVRYAWADNPDRPNLYNREGLPAPPFRTDNFSALPFWNPALPASQRIDDLLRRLTLEEKVAQMLNAAPAVPRLGIPAYDWWSEVLHGVARTPFHTTVFPQAIGMAATWDTASLALMAHYSAVEGRAVHNKATALGRNNERYLGLTYWTPNINIFRDPRWGRGQETYGEDPFLTAQLGRAFVRGLQGEHPKYLKAAACAKHFAVHSGPEPSRHADNFKPSDYDLWDTYLPAFRELVVGAKVAGVMCAYNAVRDQPCCASDLLMNDILRKQWGFKGYVTSDCWAIDDFFNYHKTHPDATSAAADAVLHGTDVECGRTVYTSLLDGVKQGLITEAQLDVSLRRLFETRFRLGMFDPPAGVPFAETTENALEAPEHRAHALKMARQAIVLLKNENNTLPLSKNIKKIAVLGPNADNPIAVLGNYNGVPSEIVTPLEGIREKVGRTAGVVYEKAVNFTNDTLLTYVDQPGRYRWAGQPGFQAEYFNNTGLQGKPEVTRTEAAVDHFWQEGQAVAGSIRAHHFSARYSTLYQAGADGYVTFEVDADDGYKFFVNGQEVLNAWQRNRWGAKTYKLDTRRDSTYTLTLEYWQGEGKAEVHLRAGLFEKSNLAAVVDRVRDADVLVYVGGISPQLEGEEMRVDFSGFNGGDRTSILLPKVQSDFLQLLRATGKPVVLVLMTGSAIAIPAEEQTLPAILNAWYGGQSAGTAIADVLFGDYNPAGRLPVTFYRGDADLPDFKNYDMTGRTYRYFNGEALYPFGYGLSYTTFEYRDLILPDGIKTGEPLRVEATVTNTGKTAGEEVVQLYVAYPEVKEKAPIRALKGFQRIGLQPGESRTVAFTLLPEQLSLVDGKGGAYQPKGKVAISVGGGQAGKGNALKKMVDVF